MKRAPLSPARIEVHIDELVLHGFAAGDRWKIADALEAELRGLLQARGVPAGWGANRARLDAGVACVNPQSQPRFVGEGVARAIYEGGGGMTFASRLVTPATAPASAARTAVFQAPLERRPQLQRKCACGGTPGPSGECDQCARRRLARASSPTDFRLLQPKLALGTPGDRDEQEAERTADRVSAGATAGELSVLGHPFQRRVADGDHSAAADAAPPIVDEVLQSAGAPLERATRGIMEARFRHDFSQVRIHTDARAARSARAVGALAYTVGRDIVFREDTFSPETKVGRQLLAHELTHVVQQRVGTSGLPVVQRDRDPDAKDTEAGQVLTVVIRAPDDPYTQNVTDYVRNTLNEKNIIEVDNIQDVFPYLEKIKQSGGPKVKKVRLIAHGSTIGGIKMKMPGKAKPEFVNPADIAKMAEDQKLQAIAGGAMASDASVEFYGCYVGGETTTEAALSKMFQSKFRGPDEALHTEDVTFEWNGKTVTSSGELDKLAQKDKKVRPQYEAWLLKQHQRLVAAGDVPDSPTRDGKIAAMRDLFDRSKGRIKTLVIEKKGGTKVRPGDKNGAWEGEWRKWNSN